MEGRLKSIFLIKFFLLVVIFFRSFVIVFFILLFTFFIVERGYTASDQGQPTQYQVTMKKVELCTDLACTSPYVVGERDMDADIASVSAGADVGNFAPTTGIPPGIVYTHLRVTISRTFTITATNAYKKSKK